MWSSPWVVHAVTAAFVTVSQPLGAQVVVNGVVLEGNSRAPVASAVVTLNDSLGRAVAVTVSSADGRFTFTVDPGRYGLLVRRVGFAPFRTDAFHAIGGPIELTVLVASDLIVLDPVTVTGEQRPFAPGPLADFERRRERNLGGVFLTYDDLQMRQPTRATEAFYGLPGVRVHKVGHRVTVIRMTGKSPLSQAGRARNRAEPDSTYPPCPPVLYIDGIRVANSDGTLNELLGSELYAIEIYRRASEMPGEFLDSDSYCGVIAVWTKRFAPVRR